MTSYKSSAFQKLLRQRQRTHISGMEQAIQLKEAQKKVRYYEGQIGYVLLELEKLGSKNDYYMQKCRQMIFDSVWVTAEQHKKIHDVFSSLGSKRSELSATQTKLQEDLQQAVEQAKELAESLDLRQRDIDYYDSQIEKWVQGVYYDNTPIPEFVQSKKMSRVKKVKNLFKSILAIF